jgi:hypothetical protein
MSEIAIVVSFGTSVSGEENLPKKNQEKPPYTAYAFLNPYNLSLLAGAGVVAAATGGWWIGLCAAAAETVWMLFAPDSTVLRRTWFDKLWDQDRRDAKQKEQAKKFAALPSEAQARVLMLRDLQARLQQLAAENPSFTVDLLRNDLGKLDGLIDDFLEMACVCDRWENHLRSINFNELDRQIGFYKHQLAQLSEGDERRDIAAKNLEVLDERRKRTSELAQSLQAARGQMELMDNTFRLLVDEIVTMRNASELGERLDDLRTGVEAVRETSRETDDLLHGVERR